MAAHIRRWLGRLAVALPLLGLGAILYASLQPTPDWTVQETASLRAQGFTPDGKHFFTFQGDWSGMNGPLHFRRLADGQRMNSVFPADGFLERTTYSQDGRFIAAGDPRGEVFVADLQEQRVWSIPMERFGKLDKYDNPAFIAISPCSELLSVYPGLFPTILEPARPYVFDLQSGEPLGPPGQICHTLFAPDDRHWILLSEGGVAVWHNRRRQEVLRIDAATPGPSVFSPNGRLLLTGVAAKEHEPIRYEVWNLDTYHRQANVALDAKYRAGCVHVAFSPDSRLLVTCPYHRTGNNDLEVWDCLTGARLGRFQMGESFQSDLTFATDASFLAVAARALDYRADDPKAPTTVCVLDLPSAKVRWTSLLPGGEPRSNPSYLLPWPRLSPDGKMLTLQRRSEAGWDFLETKTGRLVNSVRFSTEKEEVSYAGARNQASRDGRRILAYAHVNVNEPLSSFLAGWLPKAVVASEEAHTIAIVADSTTSEELARVEVPGPAAFILSPDGQSLVASMSSREGTARLSRWSVPARRPWEWIVTVPLALACGVVVVRWAWRTWRRRKG